MKIHHVKKLDSLNQTSFFFLSQGFLGTFYHRRLNVYDFTLCIFIVLMLGAVGIIRKPVVHNCILLFVCIIIEV